MSFFSWFSNAVKQWAPPPAVLKIPPTEPHVESNGFESGRLKSAALTTQSISPGTFSIIPFVLPHSRVVATRLSQRQNSEQPSRCHLFRARARRGKLIASRTRARGYARRRKSRADVAPLTCFAAQSTTNGGIIREQVAEEPNQKVEVAHGDKWARRGSYTFILNDDTTQLKRAVT